MRSIRIMEQLFTILVIGVQELLCGEVGMSSHSRKADYAPNWTEAVRTAIGQVLRTQYTSPQDLPPELYALIAQLSDQHEPPNKF